MNIVFLHPKNPAKKKITEDEQYHKKFQLDFKDEDFWKSPWYRHMTFTYERAENFLL